jgi:hypothetical protein
MFVNRDQERGKTSKLATMAQYRAQFVILLSETGAIITGIEFGIHGK